MVSDCFSGSFFKRFFLSMLAHELRPKHIGIKIHAMNKCFFMIYLFLFVSTPFYAFSYFYIKNQHHQPLNDDALELPPPPLVAAATPAATAAPTATAAIVPAPRERILVRLPLSIKN